MSKYLFTAAVVWAILTSAGSSCLAEVRLPKIIGSNMVLQRETEVAIWGWADAGEMVTVTCDWLATSTRVAADTDGKWRVDIKTGAAGGPHGLTIVGRNRISLEQILFGEVWLASGQSNMEMPLVKVSGAYTGIRDATSEVAQADYPEIRLFQVGNFSSKEPLEDVEAGISMYGIPLAECQWRRCTPESVPTFAATAYFFARHLHRELGVPVGIVDASWGGTSAEAWTPAAGLQDVGLTTELEQATNLPQKADQKIPSRLYNGMIHPLRNVRIRGAIWYQGEGNVGRADQYRILFSTMIGHWRQAFGDEVGFYYVQISPFNYQGKNAAYLREAQLETMSLAGTGMVVTMDIGNLTDIHPKNKQEVGRRLALWALAGEYERDVACSGPLYNESEFADGKARLSFTHADSGLATTDRQPPSHFEVAGADQVFHPATAEIDGAHVVVFADDVPEPTAVRYAFTSQATPNLVNVEGLPASPFRTDRW